jgi:hypothetical protein
VSAVAGSAPDQRVRALRPRAHRPVPRGRRKPSLLDGGAVCVISPATSVVALCRQHRATSHSGRLAPRSHPSRSESRRRGGPLSLDLSCAIDANFARYGSALADATGCAGALTLAAATPAFLRTGERHYGTDVRVGGATGVCLGARTLRHYGADDWTGSGALRVTPAAGLPAATVAGSF